MSRLVTTWVVDASVAAKWFVPEHDSDRAALLVQPHVSLIAPDLLYAELGSVFLKRVTRGDISSDQCATAFRKLMLMPVVTEAMSGLTGTAYRVATETGRSFYDSIYLALALIRDVPLITEDQRFWNALQDSQYRDRVIRLATLTI